MELYDKLLGVQVTPHSEDIELAYGLFVEVMELGRASNERSFNPYNCDSALPLDYFEGLLSDIVMERENEDGWRWYQFDWNRVRHFLRGIDWSDPHHAARAWVVALAYLLMDYRYLYL